MREKIAGFRDDLYNLIYSYWRGEDIDPVINLFRKHGWLHKDDPSGLIAGEHELTVQEALEDYRRIISDYPSYPHIGYYNGKRITKPIPPSEDK